MLGDQQCCFGFGIRSRYDQEGYKSLIPDGKIRGALCEADLTIGNLECSYNNQEPMAFPTHVLSINKKAVAYLQSLGFELFNLANNHTLEHGVEALTELTKVLDVHGLGYVGLNAPFMFEFNGKKIAFFGYTSVPDYKNNNAIMIWNNSELEHVRKVAGKSDFTVFNIHWGNEFIEIPSGEQIALAHSLVDAGVGLVLGTHSHVLQPVERYGDGLIVYSMGNFIFDNFLDIGRETAVFLFEINLETGRIDYDIIPVLASRLNFSLRCADKETAEKIRKLLNMSLVPVVKDVYIRRVLDKRKVYRKKVILHFARHLFLFRCKLSILMWVLKRLFFIIRYRKREQKNPNEVYTWK